VDHSIVLYLVSRALGSPLTFVQPRMRKGRGVGSCVAVGWCQIGPDGQFLDFFTQSMQPPDIVERIKQQHAQFHVAK
jgi:hypothetical protein